MNDHSTALKHLGGLKAPRSFAAGETIGTFGKGVALMSHNKTTYVSGLPPNYPQSALDTIQAAAVTVYESRTHPATVHEVAHPSSLTRTSPELAQDAACIVKDGLLAYAAKRRNACIVYKPVGPVRLGESHDVGGRDTFHHLTVLHEPVVESVSIVAVRPIRAGEDVYVVLENGARVDQVIGAVARSTNEEVEVAVALLAADVHAIAAHRGFCAAISSPTYMLAMSIVSALRLVRRSYTPHAAVARLVEALYAHPHADVTITTIGLKSVPDGRAVTLQYQHDSDRERVAVGIDGYHATSALVKRTNLNISYALAPTTPASFAACIDRQRWLLAKSINMRPEARIVERVRYAKSAEGPPPDLELACTGCGHAVAKWLLCPCGHAHYCRRECQLKDWPRHRAGCIGLRREVKSRQASVATTLARSVRIMKRLALASKKQQQVITTYISSDRMRRLRRRRHTPTLPTVVVKVYHGGQYTTVEPAKVADALKSLPECLPQSAFMAKLGHMGTFIWCYEEPVRGPTETRAAVGPAVTVRRAIEFVANDHHRPDAVTIYAVHDSDRGHVAELVLDDNEHATHSAWCFECNARTSCDCENGECSICGAVLCCKQPQKWYMDDTDHMDGPPPLH